MNPKRRAKVASVARAAAVEAVEEARTIGGVFHVLSIRFADGRGIDIPYDPWRPRQKIALPGIYDPEATPTLGTQS